MRKVFFSRPLRAESRQTTDVAVAASFRTARFLGEASPAAALSAGLLSVAIVLIGSIADAAQPRVSSASAPDLTEVIRSLDRDSSMRIEGTSIDGFSTAAGLDLVRFEPFTSDVRFVLQTDNGPRTAKPELPVYLRGSVDGMRGSVVAMSVRASGEMRGVVSGTDGTWMLTRKSGNASVLRSRRVERSAMPRSGDFSCEVLPNPMPARTGSLAPPAARSQRLPITYTAKIAVELDYDYYLNFGGDADAAILYSLDLMAFTGALGESELGMNVQVPYVQLWTTSDPYSGDSEPRLVELRSRWNEFASTNCGGGSCTGIARSTVLLLSSANTGGIAYSPSLCDSYHSATGGYSYAYTGSIEGNFNIDSPSAVWDIVATAHELGHNFGSGHTHCYSPPVDGCYASGEPGCHAGATSLPSGCPGSGQGCGTIMSYCHLLTGGEGNISLTYGAGHPYGNTPDRVPTAMMTRIGIEAADAPACLSATDGMVEIEISKAGDGSGTVTSSPTGLNCGGGCRTYFNAGTVVTLTATPNGFSAFSGWSGDPDCSDGVVTSSTATSCTATFVGSCGAGNADCNDGDPCTLDSCPGDDHCENLPAPRNPASCFAAAKSQLKVTNSADPARDKLQWQWKNGAAFDQSDLGNPSASTDHFLCVYDTTAAVSRLAMSAVIPSDGSLWRNDAPRGWQYSDKSAAVDGVKKLQLRTGVAGKTRIKLDAVGVALPLPAPYSGGEYFDADPSVVVQLVGEDDRCWSSSFDAARIGANSPGSFKASAP